MREMEIRKQKMAASEMQQAQQVPPEDAPQGAPVGPPGQVGLAAPGGGAFAQVSGKEVPGEAIPIGQPGKRLEVRAGPTRMDSLQEHLLLHSHAANHMSMSCDTSSGPQTLLLLLLLLLLLQLLLLLFIIVIIVIIIIMIIIVIIIIIIITFYSPWRPHRPYIMQVMGLYSFRRSCMMRQNRKCQ
jgi:hypothetical protein